MKNKNVLNPPVNLLFHNNSDVPQILQLAKRVTQNSSMRTTNI